MNSQKSINYEFIILMASLMSMVALSIDALLPALPEIGESLRIKDLKNNQLIITMIFLGLGLGQLVFGPLSDSFGRKPIVYIGFGIFVVASIFCVFAESIETMVIGRVLQGVGLSSPRTIAIAMVRDQYRGDLMAKILSIVVVFFILVPVIAPTLGQLMLNFGNWKIIFLANLVMGFLIVLWFWLRQDETLKKSNRIPFSFRIFYDGTMEFMRYRDSIAFTLISGFITGSFMVYLSTSQQIFEVQYGLGELFPIIFACTAIAVGVSTFINSRLVMRFGSRNIALYATVAYFLISLVYVLIFMNGSNPSIYILLAFFLAQFSTVGLLFGNLRALAMEPLGHIAGIGAAINGCISTVLAVPIANYIGGFVDDSVLPLFIGFTFFGVVSLIVFYILYKSESRV